MITTFTVILIRLWRNIATNPALLIVPVGYFNAVPIYAFITTVSGKVNMQSGYFLRRMRTLRSDKSDKIRRKKMKSISELKFRFGDNFIDFSNAPCNVEFLLGANCEYVIANV